MSAQVPPPSSDPASFHDPSNGVLRVRGRVWRYFDKQATHDFKSLTASTVLDRLLVQGRLIPYTELGQAELDEVRQIVPEAECVIEHPVIPYLSYSYEWTFNMLKDTALLHLEVLEELLEAGFILKDGNSTNVQFMGGKPTFIDIGSIRPYSEGQVWDGYTQFCCTFLNPLILQAATGLPFQPWLRSSPKGITPDALYRLLPLTAKLRRGAFVHVTLQTWLNKLFAPATEAHSPPVGKTKLGRHHLLRQARSLRRTIEKLKYGRAPSLWVDYDSSKSYSPEANQAKKVAVEAQLSALAPEVVYDCGCNLGEFSLFAARSARLVVAMDADPASVDSLYLRIRNAYSNVLPLVVDITNPSPDQGWAEEEYRGLSQRGRADLVLWLAVAHHLALSQNIPLERQALWIARFADKAIFEFVPADDPMARTLLKWHSDPSVKNHYTRQSLEGALHQHFAHVEAITLPNSERILYVASR